MQNYRPSNERGQADHGWLKAKHSFSFADYYDPKHMGFRSLRVINEDRVQAQKGFGTHGHKDMEIITYIISGELEHKDSMGNGSIIRPGEIQYMSAGNGVRHSEFNPTNDQTTHLLQIWIVPDKHDYEPKYDQRKYDLKNRLNSLLLIASGDEKDAVIHVRQDVKIYTALLNAGHSIEHSIAPNRGLWLQVVKGQLDVNGQKLSDGDGLAIENEPMVKIQSLIEAEFLLFDLK